MNMFYIYRAESKLVNNGGKSDWKLYDIIHLIMEEQKFIEQQQKQSKDAFHQEKVISYRIFNDSS